jgi:hypothetical protein
MLCLHSISAPPSARAIVLRTRTAKDQFYPWFGCIAILHPPGTKNQPFVRVCSNGCRVPFGYQLSSSALAPRYHNCSERCYALVDFVPPRTSPRSVARGMFQASAEPSTASHR